MTTDLDPQDQPGAPDLAADPYGFFAHMRRTAPVWRGGIMDMSSAPPEFVPDEEWTFFDFASVFAAFRDDETFNSDFHNRTIEIGRASCRERVSSPV